MTTTVPDPGPPILRTPLSDLAAQLHDAIEERRQEAQAVAVRVRLAGTGPALAACEIWTADAAMRWAHGADVPAGRGATMLDLERSLVAAGYVYRLTRAARPAWRYDANGAIYTLDVARP